MDGRVGAGLLKDGGSEVRSLGFNGQGGRPGGGARGHAATLLTSLAVSSHDGVSAVEPDAADDRKFGICPVEPLIVIIHS